MIVAMHRATSARAAAPAGGAPAGGAREYGWRLCGARGRRGPEKFQGVWLWGHGGTCRSVSQGPWEKLLLGGGVMSSFVGLASPRHLWDIWDGSFSSRQLDFGV